MTCFLEKLETTRPVAFVSGSGVILTRLSQNTLDEILYFLHAKVDGVVKEDIAVV